MSFIKLLCFVKYQIVLAILIMTFSQCRSSRNVVCYEDPIHAMTFNIRHDVASDSLNSWAYRKELLVETIKKYNPDFIGMQEVLNHQFGYLNDNLDEYASYGVGRRDGKEGGEFCPIYYKSAEFDVLDQGTFALSETPDVIGSKSWDAAVERITTYVVLKRRIDEAEVVVFNTHYDHRGYDARVKSSKLLKRKIREIANDRPIVLLGDFNVTRRSKAIKTLLRSQIDDAMKKSRRVSGPNWSFHAFGSIKEEERPLIDHIFVNGDFKVEDYRVIDDMVDGKYISDHCPIMVSLLLENKL